LLDARRDAGKSRGVTTVVRALGIDDLPEADRIFRVAFGTFLGLPDPTRFAGDTDFVRSRFRIAPGGAFAADHDGTLAGSVFATCWGSVGFFGPLSVRPELWGRRIAQRLLEPVLDYFAAAAVTHAGLFTFAQSAKHVGLYGKLGFYPRFLTVVVAKNVAAVSGVPGWAPLGALAAEARAHATAECRAITESLYPGLDLGIEITAALQAGLGDVVLLRDRGATVGFAVCHVGAGTEAGSDTCYVKFGAVPCGADAGPRFARLLSACEAFAVERGVHNLVVGVNLAREAAYADLRARGFRTVIQGVAMHRPNAAAYSRPDVYAVDDWR
jgi:predicted N-acetyltransferase YhbS